MRELIQAEQALGDYTRKHARHIISGELGNNAGTVDHPTRTNFVYVKLHGDDNQVVEAEAVASFPHQAGIIVAVELVKRNAASRYQVLGLASNILFVNSTWAGTVGGHAAQHQRRDLGQGGFDPLDIYNRALVNLRGRAQATPDLTVYVERGFYFIGGALYEWTGGNSAAFTVPAGSFGVTVRRCDLLYIGSDQALHIVQGATTSDGSVPAYPTTPYPCIPIAYVYLTSSSTSIGESNIKDARVILTASDGTPVAHNLLSSTHGDTLAASVVAGDIIIGNDTPKWSRLGITVPAANVRNVVGVDNGETKPSWKTTLDGTTPADIAGTAAAGTSLVFPHRDHVHRGVLSINKAADTTLYGAVTLSEGANITLTQVGQDIAIAAAGGGAHTILSATHTDTLADTVVDGDVLIGNATPKWSRLAISAPAANVRNVLGVDNTETRPSWKTALDSTNPATLTASAAAAPGTSLVFSHRDHVHPITNTAVGVASTLMATNASGGTTLTGLEVINTNAAAAPAVWLAGTTLQVVPTDDANGVMEINAFGTAAEPGLVFRRSKGTLASPTAVETGYVLAGLRCAGYGSTGWAAATRAGLAFVAAENWSDAAQGTYIDFNTTPTGSTTTSAVFYMYGDGSAKATGLIKADPVAANTAGIAIDPNGATGDYLLSLSPTNLTANRRVTFPNADVTFPLTVSQTSAITSSSNPGAAAAILASGASGELTLSGVLTVNNKEVLTLTQGALGGASSIALSVTNNYTPTADEGTYSIFGMTFDAIKLGTYAHTSSLGVRGVQGEAINNGSGAVTGIAAALAICQNLSTGTVSNSYTYYAFGPVASVAHPITTQYGLYIAAQQATGVSTGYGIYQAGTSDTNTFLGGVVCGGATGGNKGAGTINTAGDIYKNNSAYTNPAYALEHWAEGSIITHADKPGAQDYRRLTLGEVEDYVRRHYELPGHRDSFGLFDGGDWMLEKLEEAFTHLIEMDKRVVKLERGN